MIPLHAVAGANPRQLRWVVTPGSLPPVGTVQRAPGQLGTLLERGVIEDLVVRPSDVLITLHPDRNWRQAGDQIRDALTDALDDPAGWQVDTTADDTTPLAEITTELLAGPIGALAQSHGGSIELVSVTGTNVTVRMSGACHGCPAAASTLHQRLQHELRRRVNQQVTVSRETHPATSGLGKKLLSLMVH